MLAARGSLEVRGNKYTELTPTISSGATRTSAFVGRRSRRWATSAGCTAPAPAWTRGSIPTELPREILLTRTAESFGPMIAEWALARALAFSQELLDLAARQREHRWAPRDVAMIRGTTAVVVGTGDVGTHTAETVFGAWAVASSACRASGRADPSVFAEAHPVCRAARCRGAGRLADSRAAAHASRRVGSSVATCCRVSRRGVDQRGARHRRRRSGDSRRARSADGCAARRSTCSRSSRFRRRRRCGMIRA